MVGLCLRLSYVEIGSFITSRFIILDFLIFYIYYILIRFYEIYYTHF
jgi:hypothetical protein